MPAVRSAVEAVGRSVGATDSGVAGEAASAADVGAISGSDLIRIIPIVLLVLGLLLAIVLRSLVAPIYLVISVALSYLASLGFAVLVFVIIGGQDGINFVLPFFMFIFIMALGQDYNILVMTRIREEAHDAPIRVAVRRAVEATGTTVTSAGLILAGTFGVLTVAGDTQVKEIGLGLAAGILLDTFFVRTLLVPSVAVLLGRWNWWPSHLSHEDRDHDPDADPRPPVAGAGAAVSRPVADGRGAPWTEYGERAWPAERDNPPDPPWSSWSATARRRPPVRCSPVGPRASTCPTAEGPRPRRSPNGSPHLDGDRDGPGGGLRLTTRAHRRKPPDPSPGGSASGSAPIADSSSATSAVGPARSSVICPRSPSGTPCNATRAASASPTASRSSRCRRG